MLRNARVLATMALVIGVAAGCDESKPIFMIEVTVANDFDRAAIRSAYLVMTGSEPWQSEVPISAAELAVIESKGWVEKYRYHSTFDDLMGKHFELALGLYDEKKNLLAFGSAMADNGADIEVTVQAAME